MKKGDVIRQKCVNTTFYLTGILAHKVNSKRTNTVRSYNRIAACISRSLIIREPTLYVALIASQPVKVDH